MLQLWRAVRNSYGDQQVNRDADGNPIPAYIILRPNKGCHMLCQGTSSMEEYLVCDPVHPEDCEGIPMPLLPQIEDKIMKLVENITEKKWNEITHFPFMELLKYSYEKGWRDVDDSIRELEIGESFQAAMKRLEALETEIQEEFSIPWNCRIQDFVGMGDVIDVFKK